ncbi:MAG: GNAT family N-acetyltransferase [Cyclobacteriaceae bacterium]
MSISVNKIEDRSTLEQAFKIREEVFVYGQKVDPSEEYDEYEDESSHFLAFSGQQPAGTARWRFTDKGVKLERFAVLEPFRGSGVGQALVKAVLSDIKSHPHTKGKEVYLHAQLTAVGLYEKFGFKKAGDMFIECDIKHYLMKLNDFPVV